MDEKQRDPVGADPLIANAALQESPTLLIGLIHDDLAALGIDADINLHQVF